MNSRRGPITSIKAGPVHKRRSRSEVEHALAFAREHPYGISALAVEALEFSLRRRTSVMGVHLDRRGDGKLQPSRRARGDPRDHGMLASTHEGQDVRTVGELRHASKVYRHRYPSGAGDQALRWVLCETDTIDAWYPEDRRTGKDRRQP